LVFKLFNDATSTVEVRKLCAIKISSM